MGQANVTKKPPPILPVPETQRKMTVPNAGRGMGMRIVGSKGSGKSRLLGRSIIWQDFTHDVPTVLFDPTAGTIDNVLDKILRVRDPQVQKALFQRVRYIDVAGTTTHVMPFPLLYPARTPYEAAQRVVELIRRIDPKQEQNPQLGLNAIDKIATDVGMVLSGMHWQYSEAELLLRDPTRFTRQIEQAAAWYPAIVPAASFLLNDYARMKEADKDRLTNAFLRKIAFLNRDAVSRAIYAADHPAIDWQEVADKNLLVLFDFQRVSERQRPFAMIWLYLSLVEWIRVARGTGRHTPFSLVIDELSDMVGRNASNNLLADDLNRLINVIARNASVWVTVTHQEINQLSEAIQGTLMTLGTQIFGSTTDAVGAGLVAKRFYPYQPLRTKTYEAQWATATINGVPRDYIRSYHAVYYTMQEQEALNSRFVFDLPRFTFLAGIAPEEGTMPTRLQHFSIADLDRDPRTGMRQFPQEAKLRIVKERLMRRDGIPLEDGLAAIDRRTRNAQTAAIADVPHPQESMADLPTGLKRRSRIIVPPETASAD